MTSLRRAAAAALLFTTSIALVATSARPAAAETGDLWEVTSQMSMEGMPMAIPAQTHRVCSAKDWKEPPGAADEQHKCRTTEFQNTGSKVTWKMQCDGPPAMSGEGEITRNGPDAYTGSMKLQSPQGVMTMKLGGHRVGECDPAESRRQVDQRVAQIEAQIAEQQKATAVMQADACKAAVAAMDLRMLQMQAVHCTDPSLKADFCKRLETEEGFDIVAACGSRHADGATDEAAYCGKDAEKIQATLCASAFEKESLDFLGRCCPAQAQQVAQQQCAGRKYTSMGGSKYAGFCVTYAKDVMDGTSAEKAAAEPETTKSKTKKVLKGLFGR